MAKYGAGQNFSVEDANLIYERAIEHFYELPPTPAGIDLTFGKATAEITPDTETGEAEIWDKKASPPTATGQTVTDLRFYWISDQPIASGKEIVWITGTDGKKYILWAECPDPVPPSVGQLEADNQAQALTTTYADIAGMVSTYSSGSGITFPVGRSGFEITEPGTWKIDVSFTAIAAANNTDFLVRANTNAGPGAGNLYSIKVANDSASAAFTIFASVTQAEIDAGTVFLLVEAAAVAGTQNVTWAPMLISVSRIGVPA